MRTFTTILSREIRIIWIRLLIIFAIMNLMIYTDTGSSQMIIPAMIFGLFMGVDFGTRDRRTGFDLTFLTVPYSQKSISLIRFMIRFTLLVLLSAAIMKAITPETIYSRSVDFSIFWLFIVFFAISAASLCSRKGIVSVCLGIGLVLSWYLLLIGTASLDLINAPLLYVVLMPTSTPVFCLVTTTVMWFVTVLIVTGGFQKNSQSRNRISMRQTVFIWLGGAVLCAVSLLLIPHYYAMKPLNSATRISGTSLKGADKLVINARLGEFPLGTWVVDDSGSSRVSDLRGSYKMVKSTVGNYLMVYASDFRKSEVELYSIDKTKYPGVEYIRSIQGNIYYGYLRNSRFDLSPDLTRAAVTIWSHSEPNHVMLVDLSPRKNDITWRPPDMTKLDRVFAMGWIDNDNFLACVRKKNQVEIWQGSCRGTAEKIWSQPNDMSFFSNSWKEPVTIWHHERQSIFLLMEKKTTIESDTVSKEVYLMEIDEYGRETRILLHLESPKYMDLVVPECPDKMMIVQGGAQAQLMDLNTTETQSLFAFGHEDISPDCRYNSYFNNKDGISVLTVRDIESGEIMLEKPASNADVYSWFDAETIAFVAPNGNLGRVNVLTGEFTSYFVYDMEMGQ